ncbi:TetR/AcrR family transcriptional regulator [Lacticaseibacillus camelliae]|uniref:TetR family transcriptional regulator n=1 Tax=Lacticaseibacillus camelliae DSM 22697 = JCM 13995 TaxID=1423730 RepID=A0A0R2F8M7_9LACO|nr:TetR/AcrR family transcriptional regulator [Lacticaseibacillus camelliae]KRN21879.1 TetR family transcriptional regulator [Lacticaseibacillus camelliae DSM 22697 = JCM 13995]
MQVNSVETLLANSLAQSDLSEKQQNVLKACLKLFSEQGYDRTTTADIANLAGVSEGTVYKHFKNKREILDALLEPLKASVLPAVADEFVAETAKQHFDSLEAALRFLVSDRMRFVLDNRLIIRVFLQEVLVNTDLFDSALAMAKQRFVPAVMPMLVKFSQPQHPLTLEAFRPIFGLMLTYLLPVILKPELQLDVDQATAKILTNVMPALS